MSTKRYGSVATTMRPLATAAAFIFASQVAAAATIHVRDFGAKGDGRTDDGPPVRKAVAAAVAAGPGTKLVFDRKTYRLGKYEGGQGQIRLIDCNNITVAGSGSKLLLHPSNGVFDIVGCRDVVIRGFVIDFNPLPYTQGTIGAVNAAAGTFELAIHPGYPLPPSDASVKKRLGKGGWRWGSVIDPEKRHRRWDVADHFFIESVNVVPGRAPGYRIKVAQAYAKRLTPVRPGDRFFLPLMLTGKGERAFGSNTVVTRSTDCTVEDVTIHAARCGMNFAIVRNEGRITLRHCRIAFAPGSTRICTTWKDGVHSKDNRVGPLIESCSFAGMLDDSINIGANTAMAEEVFSPVEFRLKGPAFSKGDKVMVFDPVKGRVLADTRVLLLKKRGNRNTVVLADPVEKVAQGSKRPHADIKATHFYNMSYASDRFIVRNCVFKPQRRHALLVRSSHGIFERNTIDGVGGAAVWMGNEMGSFYEGPFPTDNIIRNNTIRNTQLSAIHIYTSRLGGKSRLTRDIAVENNTITTLPGKVGVSVRAASNVRIIGNHIHDSNGNDLGEAGVKIVDSTGVAVK